MGAVHKYIIIIITTIKINTNDRCIHTNQYGGKFYPIPCAPPMSYIEKSQFFRAYEYGIINKIKINCFYDRRDLCQWKLYICGDTAQNFPVFFSENFDVYKRYRSLADHVSNCGDTLTPRCQRAVATLL